MVSLDCKKDANWLTITLEALHHAGAAVVRNILPPAFIEETRRRMYLVQAAYRRDVGEERLARAGELGVLRLMMKYDAHFFKFLEIPEVLAVVDNTVSETAILHLQNGFILPSYPKSEAPSVFQNRFHMDFPRVLNGYLASVNVFFAVDAFTAENGGTLAVPGTHQKTTAPLPEYLAAAAVPVECPAGSMLVFDSTLWHAAGLNVSGSDRLAINHQFTRSFLKQQIDYVRALGQPIVLEQRPRTQQLLGWYTRVVTSLDEYYRPEPERLYRRGQG
ncbi:MAG TPA: phytanoyl-CoA dioxygenase family protein [Gemmataceae bacterium]|jgi:ectoine hydroxylase-related dioxygenase (phytanoyl-CoA dioxygenase family)|nr:phytanoyl-CoA dioxygenase family protein [Gemmataceae bacterium]